MQIHLAGYYALKKGAHPAYELCRSLGLVEELEPAAEDDVLETPENLRVFIVVLQ